MFPVVMSTGGAPDYSVGREAAGVKSLAICTTVPARGGLCCPCANGAPSAPKREALAGGGPRASPPPRPPPLPQASLCPALAVMSGQGALCHSKDPEKSPWPAALQARWRAYKTRFSPALFEIPDRF